MSIAIEISHLTKRFPPAGKFRLFSPGSQTPPAIQDINLQIQQGELFGLVGPNGAGKTTLIKCLSTLIQPTSGHAWVNGYALSNTVGILKSIGLVSNGERSFHWRLTGRQNLEFFAALQGINAENRPLRIRQVLRQVELDSAADKRVRNYSTGMRQRLSIARALLHQPKILFLDEPTSGLDPLAQKSIHRLIRENLVNRQGVTVLLTTHQLQQAEALCDRIGILHQGKLIACGSLNALSEQYRQETGHADLNRSIALDELFAHYLHSRPAVSLPAMSESPHSDTKTNEAARQSRRRFVSLRHIFRVAKAFLLRDWRAESSYRVAFGLQFLNILFSIAIFFFISKLIGPSAAPYLSKYGGSYFAFVLIGVAFSGYFGVGLSSFASSLRDAQTTGTLEAMLTTPTPVPLVVFCASLWSYALTTVEVLLYLLVGGLGMHIPFGSGNIPLALFVLLLTIITFSSLGVMAASFIMVLKRGNPITWIFSAVSNLLGGVYYPLSILPGWLQWIAHLLPITYALEALRLALLQNTGWHELQGQLIALAVFSLIFLPLSWLSLRYAVRRAKIEGSLTHY